MNQITRLKELIAPEPTVTGVSITEAEGIDAEEVWREAIQASRKVKQKERKRASQQISFDSGPVCLVCMADIHAGAVGVDYDGLQKDLELIRDTPGMYLFFVGDMLDNFIVGRLAALMLHRKFTIREEWVLVRRVVELAAPKMLACVSGNHDHWTTALSGIDYFREVWEDKAPNALYDTDDLQVTVSVGASNYRWRLRHKWRGYSQYNPTHAIEKAALFDKGLAFDIGVGAHIHTAGVSRFFNNGGKTGLAVLCGTYKFYDEYAKSGGFPQANEQTSQAVILDEHGHILAVNSLEAASQYMKRMYKE